MISSTDEMLNEILNIWQQSHSSTVYNSLSLVDDKNGNAILPLPD